MSRALINPNLSTVGNPGMCLKFVGDAYAIKKRPYDRARKAFEATKFRHGPSEPLPFDVPVVVWFDWYGTIDGEYDNWGDVAISIPNKGIFGTPKRSQGRGSRFDATVNDRAAWLGGKAKYLGWTEDVDDVRVTEVIAAPAPSSGKRLYFDPIGQTATFYKVAGGTFAMKIKDASYNWRVLEDQGYRVRVNSRSAGGDCWVYIIYQTSAKKGQRIPGRYIK